MKFNLINLLIFALGLGFNFINAQNYEWARSFGGTSVDRGLSIALDASGNIYTAGYFFGTSDFDPGVGTSYLTSKGYRDIFVQKMDAFGNFLWAKSIGNVGYDACRSMILDSLGNLYITGYFESTVDFDPGVGVYNLISNGNLDVFVLKMDSSGNLLWAKSFGGASAEESFSIAIDGSGNLYTVGFLEGTVDFNPGHGNYILNSNGNRDVFIHKMDSSGNIQWAKSFGGNLFDVGTSVVVNALGDIYITGYFMDSVDFNPGLWPYYLTSAGSRDIFILKMNTDGQLLWAYSFGGTEQDLGESVTLDVNENVFIAGRGNFLDTVDFDPGPGVFNLTTQGNFILKLDAGGNFIWVKSFNFGFITDGKSITTDASGNVYSTGNFLYTRDFDLGPGVHNLTSAGSRDIFVQKMDASGNFLWATSFGGSSSDLGQSIAVDVSGNVFITGEFDGMADFLPGPGTSYLTSAGLNDVFVVRMSQTITGIKGMENGVGLVVYPNPSTGTIQLSLPNERSNVELMISNMQGKVIFSNFYRTLTNTSINMPGGKGFYVLRLICKDKSDVIKFVIE